MKVSADQLIAAIQKRGSNWEIRDQLGVSVEKSARGW